MAGNGYLSWTMDDAHDRGRHSGPQITLKLSLVIAAVVGAFSGIGAKAADQSGVGWLNDLGTYPAAWMLIIVLIAWWFRTPLLAAGHSSAFFVAMVMSYYVYARQVLGFGVARDETIWLVAAVTVAPVAAAALNWASRSDHPAAAVVPALYAGVVLSSGPLRQYIVHIQNPFPAGVRFYPIQAIVELATGAAVIALIPGSRTQRLTAALLSMPAVWVAPKLIQLATNVAYG